MGRVDTGRRRILTGGTAWDHRTPEHTAKHSASRPARTRREPSTGHRQNRHHRCPADQEQSADAGKRITEDFDRATRGRRPRRRDRIGQGSESLNQAVEKTEDASGRDGSSTG
jgi:hypothetical protein